jgi:purine-binding chemotaxis protein CheW
MNGVDAKTDGGNGSHDNNDFVTMTVHGQMFGIPVLGVQDVLRSPSITRIPLAPAEVAGALNLRGRIVTAIDVRKRLRLPVREGDSKGMSIVVDHAGELYSLIIDSVWREVSAGVYRLEKQLLVVLDVNRLLDFKKVAEAA